MINMTVYNVQNMTGLWSLGDSLTGDLMTPSILFVIFFAILIALKGSKIAISSASLVCLLLSLVLQSLGFVNEGITLLFLTALAVSFVYALLKD